MGRGDGLCAMAGVDEVNPRTNEKYSCASLFGQFMKSPVGQVFVLFVLTIPLGIWSLVVASDSFSILDEAVGDFHAIVEAWAVSPITDIEVVGSAPGDECRAGWTPFATPPAWPGSNSGPCACPSSSYQPFNTASQSEYTQGLAYVYGSDRSVSVGKWKTSTCSSSSTTTTLDYQRWSTSPYCGSYWGSCIKSTDGVHCSVK